MGRNFHWFDRYVSWMKNHLETHITYSFTYKISTKYVIFKFNAEAEAEKIKFSSMHSACHNQ